MEAFKELHLWKNRRHALGSGELSAIVENKMLIRIFIIRLKYMDHKII